MSQAHESQETREFIWDHTVEFVSDLETAEREFAAHGLTAKYGGKHVGHGTENALSYFGVNYLELLSLYSKQEAESESLETGLFYRDAARLLPEHERFYRHGLRVQNIEQVADDLHAKGIVTGPVIPGNRTTADGKEIRWKLLWILSDSKADDDGLFYPFVLDWLEDEATHRETLEASGLLHQHPLGEVTTQRAIYEVPDPAAVSARWSEVFAFPRTQGDGYYDLDAGDGRYWRFVQGDFNGITELNFNVPAGESFDFTIGHGRYRSL